MAKCTYCGGTKFYEGPSGGMSTNVLCANPECRHWFNSTPALGLFEDLHRVEPTDEEKKVEAEKVKRSVNLGQGRVLVKKDVVYEEGRRLYREGKSARSCFEHPNDPYARSEAEGLWLAGWLDAFKADTPKGTRSDG